MTRKITRVAASIALGLSEQLVLGDVESRRDWGFAVDYVRAASLMAQADEPRDFVIATGRAHTVREFAEIAFSAVGLDLDKHIVIDPDLRRARGQVADLVGDASAIHAALGWSPTVSFDGLVRLMVDADLKALADDSGATPSGEHAGTAN